MPGKDLCERSEETRTGLRDRLSADIAWPEPGVLPWPWSYRISGALSFSPAVELYEAGALVDVVSSTRLDVPVLRAARSARVGDSWRVAAWGRLPLTPGVPAVEFTSGRLSVSRRTVVPVRLTHWCWIAVTHGRYAAVTASYGGTAVRQRLRAGRSCP